MPRNINVDVYLGAEEIAGSNNHIKNAVIAPIYFSNIRYHRVGTALKSDYVTPTQH
jgi:hypothetical protein